MSLFIETLVKMLRIDSALQDEGNDLRKVLDRTVGEYMDASEVVFDQLFLSSATGGWLDAHGKDYGVPRRLDEDDDSYRERIIFEKLEYLTVGNLQSIYGLDLYAFVSGFNPKVNQLTSDNPYIASRYMSIADESTRDILNNKFILDSGIVWLDESSFVNPNKIINVNGEDILYKYLNIFSEINTDRFFASNSEIKEMTLILNRTLSCKKMLRMCLSLTSLNLNLPNATECNDMLMGCFSLTSIDLDLPKAIHCEDMLMGCSSLTSLNLNLPNATDCSAMLHGCSSLSSIDLNLPNATNCYMMLRGCSSLLNIDLDLPNATECSMMLMNCQNLVNVKLNLPKLERYDQMFLDSSNIETIDVTIPTNIITDFKSMVQDCRINNLTSFKINGEEQL